MKKIVIFTLALILMGSVALAAEQKGAQTQTMIQEAEGQGTGQSQEVQAEQTTQNQGEEQQIQSQAREETRVREGDQEKGSQNGKVIMAQEKQRKAGTISEARSMVQERKQEMAQEMQILSNVEQKVYKNQNKVREAVHALLAMEDLVKGIGPQVSQIAREFNNSIEKTVMAEEKIQKRNVFARFFMGGDKKAAEEIEGELTQNRQRVLELRQLKKDCLDCDEEVETMMQEQIENIEQEQGRLQQLVNKEKKSRGVFGWIRSWFGR